MIYIFFKNLYNIQVFNMYSILILFNMYSILKIMIRSGKFKISVDFYYDLFENEMKSMNIGFIEII